MKKEHSKTTLQNAKLHETLSPLLNAAYLEIQELSKKKPDATISPQKTKLLNRLLTDILELLKDEPEKKYLDLINEEEDLPHHSDVALTLSQYASALRQFHDRYHGYSQVEGARVWHVQTTEDIE